MSSTRTFSITLSNEMAELVRAKVAGGVYATESEVIYDGWRSLMARDLAVEAWLLSTVAPASYALQADPSQGIPAATLRNHLAARRRKSAAKKE